MCFIGFLNPRALPAKFPKKPGRFAKRIKGSDGCIAAGETRKFRGLHDLSQYDNDDQQSNRRDRAAKRKSVAFLVVWLDV